MVCECSFTNADEVVKFLFLTHNQDKRVHEDLLKQMKETTMLSDMVRIAKTTESMVHSETLSTQYLETVKSTKTIEAVKCDGSRNRNKGQQQNRSRSNSYSSQLTSTWFLVAIVVTNTLLESAKLTKRSVTSVAMKDILHLFVIPDLSLLQDLAHLHRKAMESHNNTNPNVMLMKLMIIQIFNLTLLTLSQRDIAMYLGISCLMKSQE